MHQLSNLANNFKSTLANKRHDEIKRSTRELVGWLHQKGQVTWWTVLSDFIYILTCSTKQWGWSCIWGSTTKRNVTTAFGDEDDADIYIYIYMAIVFVYDAPASCWHAEGKRASVVHEQTQLCLSFSQSCLKNEVWLRWKIKLDASTR
jgi:hypothetical protein